MALSATQKQKILRMLCYPLGTIDSSHVNYSSQVADRLTYVSGDGQTEVESLITKIDAVDTKLASSVNQMGVKRIDDIELYENKAQELRSEKKRLIEELGDLLNVPSRCRSSRMSNVSC